MISRRQKRDVLRACIETLETRALLSATFTTATDYATGLEPVGMVSADFNGDGRADLATVNEAGNSISILISNGDGTLRPAINVAVENTPNSIAVGDFNGDGRADLVVNGNIPSPDATAFFIPPPTQVLSVLLGNGDGTFQPRADIVVPAIARYVTAGDVNGDGRADVLDIESAGSISVHLGNGDGTFAPATFFSANSQTSTVTIADVNGDGAADLVTTNFVNTANSAPVSVIPGNGDGTFGARVDLALPVSVSMLKVADVNGDSRADLVTDNTNGSVSVLTGNGDGTFAAPITTAVLFNNASIAVGDINHDGKLDVAVSSSALSAVALLGNGEGTFIAGPVVVENGFTAINLVDLNGDGNLDLVGTSVTNGNVSVLPGNGDGTFPGPSSYHSIGALQSVDYNGDGRTDLLGPGPFYLPNDGDGTLGLPTPTGGFSDRAALGDLNGDGLLDEISVSGLKTASIAFRNPDGSFAPPVTLTIGNRIVNAAIGDFNGDGKADIAFGDFGVAATSGINGDEGISSPGSPGVPPSLDVVLGNGNGTFSAPVIDYTHTIATLLGQASPPVSVADFNRDGRDDLLTYGMEVLLSNGDGTFHDAPPSNIVTPLAVDSIAVNDFNGDGKLDLAIGASESNTLAVVLGNGDGTFGSGTNYTVFSNFQFAPRGTFSVKSADFNQDGIPDLAAADGLNQVAILKGNGDGTFGPAVGYDAGGAFSIAVIDANNDGLPDIAATLSQTGSVRVLLNTGQDVQDISTAVTFGIGAPARVTAGSAFSITVTALDANGNPVPNFRGTVKLSTFDAGASLPAFYTFTAADGGAHSFMATLTTAGPVSISASDPRLATGRTTVQVSAAAAVMFGVSLPTTSVAAGTPFTISVAARDRFGNIATGYTGTVHFTSNDSAANLPGDYTFSAADQGVRTFTVTLRTAGVFTPGSSGIFGVIVASGPSISVADVASGISGIGLGVTIVPGAVSTLRLFAVPSVIANAGSSITIEAVDAFGNIEANYNGLLHFSSSDPKAVLPGDLATSGSGILSAAPVLRTMGTQTITVTDLNNPALSATVAQSVAAGAPQGIALTPVITSMTAGSVMAITVTVRDAFGNTTAGYTGTIHLTSSDGHAILPADYAFTAADAGVHTFNVALTTAGTAQWILFSDTVTSSLAASASGITVRPAAAATFVVSGYPATVAGTANSFTLIAKDAFGNIATGYTGTVQFTSSDAQAALPPGYTFTAADAGAHTFIATLKTAGAQSLTASDGAGVTGSQSSIAVTAGAAVRIVLSAPTTATTGKSFTVTATAVDAFGNVAPSYRGKVHFTDTVSAGLPSDYTFGAADNGVHVFSITLNTAGAQTLKLTDTVNSSILGSATVNAQAPASGGGGTGGGGGGGGGGGRAA